MEEKLEKIRKFAKGLMFSDEITTEGDIGKDLMDILEDKQYQFPKVTLSYLDDKGRKEIRMKLEVRQPNDRFILASVETTNYDNDFSEEAKKEVIDDMKELIFKKVGKAFLEMAMERE